MEGKSALFKTFGGLDSIPIVLDTAIPMRSSRHSSVCGRASVRVNLEDISAPCCFEIERRVIEALDCPVMHDDQHGTAIVVLAALLGATAVLERKMSSLTMVISGAGAAGVACANILLAAGLTNITVLDSKGIVHSDRGDLNGVKADLVARTNPEGAHRWLGRGPQGSRCVPGSLCRQGSRGIDRHHGPGGSSSPAPTPTRRSIRRPPRVAKGDRRHRAQ